MFSDLNGRLTPTDDVLLPPNRALRLGDGVFETVRVWNGLPVLADRHIRRLQAGMAAIGLPLPAEPKVWTSRLQNLLVVNGNVPDARIRITVWRNGEGSYRPQQSGWSSLLEQWTLPADLWPQGQAVRLGVCADVRPQPSPFSAYKTLSSLPYVWAARQAADWGWDDMILLAPDGSVAETAGSNVFVLNGSALTTPPLTTGCIGGVMRGWLLDRAASWGLKPKEKTVTLNDLGTAEAVWLTNAMGIRPVAEVQGVRPFAVPKPVPALWLEALRKEAAAF